MREKDTAESVLPASAIRVHSLAVEDPRPMTFASKRSWPFKAEETSPLAWWRTISSDSLHCSERSLLQSTLEQIEVLRCSEGFAAALKGDSAAAIEVAFTLMPMEEMTLTADVAMTALLRCTLDRNAAAAMVMAQILGLTNLDHSFAMDLAASWLVYRRRYAADPHKFDEAETVLLAAFQKHHCYGDDA